MIETANFHIDSPGHQALEDLIGLLARQAARDDYRIDRAGEGECAARGVEANGR